MNATTNDSQIFLLPFEFYMCMRLFDSLCKIGEKISKQIIQIRMHFKSLFILFGLLDALHIFTIHFTDFPANGTKKCIIFTERKNMFHNGIVVKQFLFKWWNALVFIPIAGSHLAIQREIINSLVHTIDFLMNVFLSAQWAWNLFDAIQ